MNASVDHQCMQFHQQPLMDGMALMPPMEGFSDSTLVTTNPTTMSPQGNSCGQLAPKSNAFKPIRKRSRASKRIPITLLNANTTNFRTLVQKFTGCPPSTALSFAFHKGPITLNFQQGNKQQIHHHHHTTRAMPSFGTTSYNQLPMPLPWQKQLPEQVPMQQVMEEQQSNFLPASNSDGLLMNNDFSLHELTVSAFSNDNDGFFM